MNHHHVEKIVMNGSWHLTPTPTLHGGNLSTTATTHHSTGKMSPLWKIILYLAYSFIFFLGTTGNARVIYYLVRQKRKLRRGLGMLQRALKTFLMGDVSYQFLILCQRNVILLCSAADSWSVKTSIIIVIIVIIIHVDKQTLHQTINRLLDLILDDFFCLKDSIQKVIDKNSQFFLEKIAIFSKCTYRDQ